MLRALWKIRTMAERREIDAVLFSSMVTASLALPLRAHLRRCEVLASAIVHGRDVTLDIPFYQRLVPRVFSALDAVLPVSSATGNACLARGLDASKLFVVPNGVALHRFAPSQSNGTARSMLTRRFPDQNLPDRGLLLCSVGRQVKRKGFPWFISEVMPLLPDDVHYWLAGDGPEMDDILAAAQRSGVRHRVRLLGRVSESDLELLYAGSDLFIMPNIPVAGDMEGFGVVMLEAGLSGLPTIGSRLEGITDVINEGQNGHLVSSGDAWGFSEAIMQYYRNDDRHFEARSSAIQYVRDRYSWRAVADRYVHVLDTLTAPIPISEEALV
jgi:phosphatidylinositol alpha-1,6-mannosyltransferase